MPLIPSFNPTTSAQILRDNDVPRGVVWEGISFWGIDCLNVVDIYFRIPEFFRDSQVNPPLLWPLSMPWPPVIPPLVLSLTKKRTPFTSLRWRDVSLACLVDDQVHACFILVPERASFISSDLHPSIYGTGSV